MLQQQGFLHRFCSFAFDVVVVVVVVVKNRSDDGDDFAVELFDDVSSLRPEADLRRPEEAGKKYGKEAPVEKRRKEAASECVGSSIGISAGAAFSIRGFRFEKALEENDAADNDE